MHIEEIVRNESSDFNDIAARYGGIFFTESWTSLFQDRLQQVGIYDGGGRLIGGFVVYRERKWGVTVLRNPPFTPAVGPFLKVEATNYVAVMDLWKEVQSLIAKFLESKGYSLISLSFDTGVIDMQPFIWKGFKVVPGYTYIVDLSMSEDELLRRMSTDRRKSLRRAIKEGLEARRVADLRIIRDLVKKTFQRQEMTVNERYLDKILFEFAQDDVNAFAFVTYDRRNRTLAGNFCIRDREKAYYILGGYDETNKHHGAGAMAMWEAMRHAKELGLKYFDFEGSMVPQIERYFRGFGGTLTPYYRVNKAILPIEILLKFFKRELF